MAGIVVDEMACDIITSTPLIVPHRSVWRRSMAANGDSYGALGDVEYISIAVFLMPKPFVIVRRQAAISARIFRKRRQYQQLSISLI